MSPAKSTLKHLLFLLALVVAALFLKPTKPASASGQTVNPVLGDISFETKFGRRPDATTDNELRIRTHLEYAEKLLRQKDASALPLALQEKRQQALDRLHDYWTAGRFPRNYDYAAQRKPCFIDRDGTICAVGYLVEQTAGRAVAEQINQLHQYDELLAMNDQRVEEWVRTSGLTKEECAMIQPTYGPEPVVTYNHIKPWYGATSALLGGTSVAANTINGIQLINGGGNKTAPAIGLITGVSQVVLGSGVLLTRGRSFGVPERVNESETILSMLNIGLGTATAGLSAWNLFTKCPPKDKLTTWNVYSYPTRTHDTGLAFSLTRRF
ncbi:hypothetical protein LJY25_08680 [Hymenobacter sp. BT175]|uniref:hypothetical protein n=1 Tax=Hymenobacter translucens TaxID=2886507 RepID=UPI001D0EE86C|nr:hypothetical protein [Hymenobacter translucens]MCC2546515.1 hypothetical protein [Hymenobacter translucens]